MAKLNYHGTFSECVGHFRGLVVKMFSISGGVIAMKMRGFFKHSDPFKDWFIDQNLPRGENLLKLEMFLLRLGYEIDGKREFTDRKALISLIVCGGIPLSEIAKELSTNHDTIYRWSKGIIIPMNERRSRMSEFIENHRGNIVAGETSWIQFAEDILSDLQIKDDEAEVISCEREKPVLDLVGCDTLPAIALRKAIVESLAHGIMALIPLAQVVISDSFTAEERKKLRELTNVGSTHGVFELSNLLNGLCGEKARSTTKKGSE